LIAAFVGYGGVYNVACRVVEECRGYCRCHASINANRGHGVEDVEVNQLTFDVSLNICLLALVCRYYAMQ
jgi:hypothetical protein